MDVELRRSSRIIQVGMKCHHKYPYKRKAEGCGAGGGGEGEVRGQADTQRTAGENETLGAGRHTENSRRKWNLGGRDQSDAARKPMSAGSHSLQETRTSLKGTWSSQHLDFSPVNLMLRFWSLELWQNTFLLFQAISFVVICYISHRQQIHRSKSASLQNSCSKPLMCTQPPSLKIQLL